MSDRMGFLFEVARRYGSIRMAVVTEGSAEKTVYSLNYGEHGGFVGTEREIRRRVGEIEAKEYLAKTEGLNVSERAGLCTCGFQGEEGQNA